MLINTVVLQNAAADKYPPTSSAVVAAFHTPIPTCPGDRVVESTPTSGGRNCAVTKSLSKEYKESYVAVKSCTSPRPSAAVKTK